MTSNPEVPPAIQELRNAMSHVRIAQETGALSINLARYDAETDGINQEFLGRFLGALPIEPGFAGSELGCKHASKIVVRDPLNVRLATSYGIFVREKSYLSQPEATLLIGERKREEQGTSFMDVITVGWSRSIDEATKDWTVPVPRLHTFSVLAEPWQSLRNQAINKLSQPYSKDEMMEIYDSNLNAFCLKWSQLDSTKATNINPNSGYSYFNPRQALRALKKHTSLKERDIALDSHKKRTLLSSDIEDYDVMMHLEYLAAAFGVGERLDAIKATRESRMPIHPAEKMFELPNYRQVIEGGSPIQPPIL